MPCFDESYAVSNPNQYDWSSMPTYPQYGLDIYHLQTALFEIQSAKQEAARRIEKEKRAKEAAVVGIATKKFWEDVRNKTPDLEVLYAIENDLPVTDKYNPTQKIQIKEYQRFKKETLPTFVDGIKFICELGDGPIQLGQIVSHIGESVIQDLNPKSPQPLTEKEVTYIPKPSCSNPLYLLTMVFFRAFRETFIDLIFNKIFAV